MLFVAVLLQKIRAIVQFYHNNLDGIKENHNDDNKRNVAKETASVLLCHDVVVTTVVLSFLSIQQGQYHSR
jgi:hypothetical protein